MAVQASQVSIYQKSSSSGSDDLSLNYAGSIIVLQSEPTVLAARRGVCVFGKLEFEAVLADDECSGYLLKMSQVDDTVSSERRGQNLVDIAFP